MICNPGQGWIEGVSILIAIALIILIGSCNDWSKDSKFAEINALAQNGSVPVIRGKAGCSTNVSIWNLVAGDVILLREGDSVPADCIIIESTNVAVDESNFPERSDYVEKNTDKDPFLFANSNLVNGHCKAVVAVVGDHSSRKEGTPEIDTEGKTELENKLQTLSVTFTFIGIISALIITATLIIILVIQVSADDDVKGDTFVKKLVEDIILGIIIIMVAIPEGLPLTISIALAYSVKRMYNKDRILLRDQQAPEKMGQVEEFCTGKTGSLTTEEMKVVKFYAQFCLVLNSRKNTIHECQINTDTVQLMKESIIYNSSVNIEMNEDAFYVPVGNSTEVSLFKFLQDAEIPVHEIIRNKEGRVLYEDAFSTIRKRSLVALKHPDIEGIVRVYVKGAPEIVIEKCSHFFGPTGGLQHMKDSDLQYVLNDCLKENMASQGLRTLAFSYRDFEEQEFERMLETDQLTEQLEQNMTFTCLMALEDPLRDRVQKVVKYAKKGSIEVRIISGDHIETVKAVAIDAGILDAEVIQNLPLEDEHKWAMDA
mmetsp:Transcript_23024/g.31395  ORF Transcript_23024/g.31395 Transcript_23024/m.31395 type:complete len:541 (+) Transcript_23024:427-2049(+)